MKSLLIMNLIITFVKNNKIMEILLTILSTIIGAILGAYISYKIFVQFTIQNQIKCLKNIIRLKLSNKRDMDFYGKYLHNGYSELRFLSEEIGEIDKILEEINFGIYKLTGKSNKYCDTLKEKFKYISNDIWLINQVIYLYIKIKYPDILKCKPDILDMKLIGFEHTFDASNIINNIQLKSSNTELQKLWDDFSIKNGHKKNIHSFVLL